MQITSGKADENGFGWQIIVGLGKTGDSVSVFPQQAKTFVDFPNGSPGLEYQFSVSDPGEFEASFYLIPTQSLVPGNGLRFAVSVDEETPQVVTVDKDIDVPSPNWTRNILSKTTVGRSRFRLKRGNHVLKIFAVDPGVVVDKIVLSTGKLPTSYFGPPETIAQ